MGLPMHDQSIDNTLSDSLSLLLRALLRLALESFVTVATSGTVAGRKRAAGARTSQRAHTQHDSDEGQREREQTAEGVFATGQTVPCA